MPFFVLRSLCYAWIMDKITPFGKLQETKVAEPGVYSVHFELPYNPEAYLISETTQLEDDLPLTLENF